MFSNEAGLGSLAVLHGTAAVSYTHLFEGVKLMAPKGWHEVLTWVYGDYMELPPEEKRVPAHSDLEIEVW